MDTLARFLDMGGYARYVWPAFGLALIVLGGLLVESLASYSRLQRQLAAMERLRR